jgi:glycosyltransferase involved in cell wall biosynthesis
MNKISACLVIRNEENIITRCLASLVGVVDEIIIVHDGECDDKTLELCINFKAKIFVRPYVGAMEAHIPFAYEQAANEWILRIDADEFLNDESRRRLKELTEDQTISAYEFLWPVWDGVKYVTKDWPYKICFFQKSKISFLGVVHHATIVSGKIKKERLLLEHRPNYNNFTLESFKFKWMKWARIQAQTYFKDLADIKKFNYTIFSWPLTVRARKNFPILLIPIDFILTFSRSFFSGGWREGCWGIKISFLHGFYKIVLDYYIYKVKREL